tara:strand:- start:106522 stop:106776 length:255 start_codon:yes stop_codon:yes gene_type:complete
MSDLDDIDDFLKVYKGLKPRERKLLKHITRLQETSFSAPAHWNREPTKAMLDREEQCRIQSVKDSAKLADAVTELSSSLRSPFL